MSFISARQSESSASRVSSEMDDTEDGGDESKRRCRNLSEKKRRDQFNILINELCSMVSFSARKMDKSTVLKATISFLKAHNEPISPSQVEELHGDWKPAILSNEEFTYLMLEAVDGFIIVIADSGKVLYVSESVTSLLGHLPTDFVSSTLYDFMPSEERVSLYNILTNPPDEAYKQKSSLILNVRLGGLEDHDDNHKYQLVQLNGYYKRFTSADSSESDSTKFVFVCIGKLLDSDLLREMSTVVDALNTEFSSRQSMEWKFIYLDQRAPPIIGYLPIEVVGTSGYDYIHIEDLDKIASCHEELMQKGECTSCVHRFLTKGQQWIWLQTRYHITHNQWTSKPEFIVCTHRVVSYADVIQSLRGDIKPIVSMDSPSLPLFGASSAQTKVKREPGANPPESDSPSMGESMSSSRRHSLQHNTCGSTGSKRSSHGRRVDLPPKFAVAMNSSIQSFHHSGLSHQPRISANDYNIAPNTSMIAQHDSLISSTAPTLAVCIQPQVTPFVHPQGRISQPSATVVSLPALSQPDIPVALPLTAFQLHPLPTHSPSNLTGYSPGLLLAPAQSGFQDQLMKKQADLQRHILQQQEELRRVSEQLLMGHCEVVPNEIPFLMPGTNSQPLQIPIHSLHNTNAVSVQGYSDILQYQSSATTFSSQSHSANQ